MNLYGLLIGLQVFQVLFLWTHDWVPMGRLNDVSAVRRADPIGRLVRITLFQSVPYSYGLYWSLHAHMLSEGLLTYLWVSYGLLFLGQLRAWWVPYLLKAEPERAARYQLMFGQTHVFLPVRNGIVPNTLHVLLHISTLMTLMVLAGLSLLKTIALQM